jgi:hypothetical protein
MKTISSLSLAVSVAALSFSVAPAMAQDTAEALAQGCTDSPSSCAALIEAQIATLQAAGLAGSELDAAIGQLVSAVYAAASRTAAPVANVQLAAAITRASSFIASPTARAGVTRAAQTVASGSASTTAPTAFGLSATTTTTGTAGTAGSAN